MVPIDSQGGFRGFFRSPKTILGFFLVLLAILSLSLYSLIRIFADKSEFWHYIPVLLIFGASAFVVVAVGVFVTACLNPEKLMLGEVQGEVYLQLLKLRQGDSVTGDVIESVTVQKSDTQSAGNKLIGNLTINKETEQNG